MALSDNIRKRRIQLGMTQGQLANRLNVSEMAISKFENDLAKPQPKLFVMLADALGTTCKELVEGDDES